MDWATRTARRRVRPLSRQGRWGNIEEWQQTWGFNHVKMRIKPSKMGFNHQKVEFTCQKMRFDHQKLGFNHQKFGFTQKKW
jgi:hypothetical protein